MSDTKIYETPVAAKLTSKKVKEAFPNAYASGDVFLIAVTETRTDVNGNEYIHMYFGKKIESTSTFKRSKLDDQFGTTQEKYIRLLRGHRKGTPVKAGEMVAGQMFPNVRIQIIESTDKPYDSCSPKKRTSDGSFVTTDGGNLIYEDTFMYDESETFPDVILPKDPWVKASAQEVE